MFQDKDGPFTSINALVSREFLVLALVVCFLMILILILRLKEYRVRSIRSLMLLQEQENQIAELKQKFFNSEKFLNENKSGLGLLPEITSILGQTQDFKVSLQSAFSKMLELLAIDFGILCLDKEAKTEIKICVGISDTFLNVLHNVFKRNIVLEANPRPVQRLSSKDFQRSRVAKTMGQAQSLLGFACKVKSDPVGTFIVGFYEPHSYTEAELDALQFCADQFAAAYEISQQLFSTQELVQLQHDYISNVSHELRTPLSTIYGYLDILRSYPDNSFGDQEKHEILFVMSDECQRLIRLVDNLLLTAQVEQEDFTEKINRVSVSLGQVISRALRFMDRDLKTRNIQVAADISVDLPLIEGDPDLLYQVFQNLLANSIKFSHKDPKIEIIVREEDQAVVISLTDNGVGIEEKDLPRIFQKFYRCHSQASKQPGLGIGLYLVQRLVNLHDGEIRVTSQPNKGTTFIMKFPKTAGERHLVKRAIG